MPTTACNGRLSFDTPFIKTLGKGLVLFVSDVGMIGGSSHTKVLSFNNKQRIFKLLRDGEEQISIRRLRRLMLIIRDEN